MINLVKKIAIVGSEEKYWTPETRTKAIKEIYRILTDKPYYWGLSNTVFISGGCPKGGIDIWAEIIADVLGFKKEIYLPEVNQWNDKNDGMNQWGFPETVYAGYKTRNIRIAKNCDVLYCIDPKSRGETFTGGKFTCRVASDLGKEVHLVEIE